eukprot:CAMPEP_0171649350 /NCGR_PEP_ID=MMETSP0990-20121206/36735_1 /TAXON_ID=483369 /ORGANISM="non described non described, Strain CCMP2098" /LENGTH=42 /DNA_ID= /DNA_START= /DNA_END= /DNA_ORIENTATION=
MLRNVARLSSVVDNDEDFSVGNATFDRTKERTKKQQQGEAQE